jgi:glutamine synthetase
MACKKCKEKKSELLYIMNPRCGWCTKADPVVEELRKDGFNITSLDVTDSKDQVRANEVKVKHGVQCGTPLFLDAGTGNMVCGFREKEVLEKWAKGEEVPAPQPRTPPSPKPNNQAEPPKEQRMKFEYIWVDGSSPGKLRSKVRFDVVSIDKIANQKEFAGLIPEWSFDGSSTGQAEVNESDLILKPVTVVPNTTERARTPSFVVLCEVYDTEGKPHKTNKRASLRESLKRGTENDMQFGIEQEYTIVDPISGKPFGWSDYENDTPEPQGDYYCGVGADVTMMRDLSESHAMACNSAGVFVHGTNAEVMLSQWEYQLKETTAIESSDGLWLSRFFLQRLAERMNLAISYSPKMIESDEWNGSGVHINFSTKYMRESADIPYMTLICSFMEDYHKDAMSHYGTGNEKRLTGNNETSKYDEYNWGEMDRTASIRIPYSTTKNGNGYLEDRRPAANVDPYEAIEHLSSTLCKINEEVLVST